MEKTVKIIFDQHELIKLIIEKEVFYCEMCCQWWQSGPFCWTKGSYESYPWLGICNPCNERMIESRDKWNAKQNKE